jgi:hypothetical protein
LYRYERIDTNGDRTSSYSPIDGKEIAGVIMPPLKITNILFGKRRLPSWNGGPGPLLREGK